MIEYISSNTQQTQNVASQLAPILNTGDCITLEGDLGAGKTCFAKGLISAWAGVLVNEVQSPTFNLVQTYDKASQRLWHYDLYRLEQAEELQELGLEETLETGINLIEWPQIAQEYLPDDCLRITIEIYDNTRVIHADAGASWQARLNDWGI